MATEAGAAILDRMARRKLPANKPQVSPPDDGGPVLYVRMPPKVHAALAAYLRADPKEPKRQDVGLDALTDFLEKKGFWPPKE